MHTYMCILYMSRPKVLPCMENKTTGLTRDSYDDIYNTMQTHNDCYMYTNRNRQ